LARPLQNKGGIKEGFMESTVISTPQSIQELNARLLEEYRASQPESSTVSAAEAKSSAFASTLEKIERKDLPPPVALAKTAPLIPPQSTTAQTASPVSSGVSSQQATGAQTSPSEEVQASFDCDDPKISRSARMQCAEKATHVEYQDDDFGVDDLVDFLNPLHHIPIIGSLYRELTGDEIKPEVQVAGGFMFGLATGSVLLSGASSILSAAMEQHTGEEPTIQVAEALFGEDFLGVPDPRTEQKIVVADAGSMSSQTASSQTTAQAVPVAPVTQIADATQEAAVETAVQAEKKSVVAEAKQDNAQQAVALPGLMAATGGMRVGNTIYTSPALRSAAHISTAAKTQPSPSAAPVQPVEAEKKEVSTATVQNEAAVAAADADQSLGALIHQQAKAREEGRALPPQLVQDMMMKALDKYKMAHAVGGSSYATAAR
jgi:hypothetical protein